jgi:ATP-dependent DNA helicase RecG
VKPSSGASAVKRRSLAPAKSGASGLERFAKLGIRRDLDLLLHLPMRYEDETRLVPISEVFSGQHVQVQGQVTRCEVVLRPRRNLLVDLAQDGERLTLRFFHFYGSQIKQFSVGQWIRAVGEVRGGFVGREILHPRYKVVEPDTPLSKRLTPVYPSGAGISQPMIRSAVRRALTQYQWPETLPSDLLNTLKATSGSMGVSTDAALRYLHAPPVEASPVSLAEKSDPAWQRIIFDELLAQQLSLRRARLSRATQMAYALPSGNSMDAESSKVSGLLAGLPFSLTAAQQKVFREIASDLHLCIPMNRLLQGDVGSGKTVVAALAACQAVDAGFQVALMAPTEILSEQHFLKLSPMLERLGIRCARLAGSLKDSEKKRVRALVLAHDVDVLVGTHALIESTLVFAKLGLAIIDEQHRFGVEQRLKLRHAGYQGKTPHQLMMSATPIPRTLAMSYYADLDVSVIDELPPGRQPIATRLVGSGRREEIIDRVREAVAEGRQVYWVCPLIEESEALDLQTAINTQHDLAAALTPSPVGLLHGRMPAMEKQATMAAFVAREIPVLVATTVIEVGVDVPNASLMVIEHAERFGLAQLHQLRGRVGRGSAQSVCVLIYQGPLSETGKQRLKTMYESQDGFEIARRDLQIRGPGEFLGARQSGLPLLRFADLERDIDWVELAREFAATMLAHYPEHCDKHLHYWLGGKEEFLKA